MVMNWGLTSSNFLELDLRFLKQKFLSHRTPTPPRAFKGTVNNLPSNFESQMSSKWWDGGQLKDRRWEGEEDMLRGPTFMPACLYKCSQKLLNQLVTIIIDWQ